MTNPNSIIPEEWQGPTMYLVGVNLIFYIFTSIIGGGIIFTGPRALVLFGISIDSLQAGWFWTPFTSLFTHSSISHLGSNMIFLLVFGLRMEERNYSDRGIYFAYLATGFIAGTLSMFLFFESSSLSVGASGCVFGLLGLNYGIEKKESNPNSRKILGVSIIFLIFSGTSPSTNIFAHLFGWIAGYILGFSDYFQKFNMELEKFT